jgi:hypothetical protein
LLELRHTGDQGFQAWIGARSDFTTHGLNLLRGPNEPLCAAANRWLPQRLGFAGYSASVGRRLQNPHPPRPGALRQHSGPTYSV